MTDRYVYPWTDNWAGTQHFGMTLRQWYAGLAMQGMLANPEPCVSNCTYEVLANSAWLAADAMIAAEKESKP